MIHSIKLLCLVCGLFIFSPLSKSQEKIPVERCHQFLKGVPVNCMQSNDVNMLWVGTNMGLYVFNYFEGVRTIMEDGAVTALAEDERGYVWCSLAGGEVVSADKKKRFKVGNGDVEIKSLQIRNNEIWIATASNGIYVWDMNSLTVAAHYEAANSELPSDKVNFVFKDEDQTIWAGTKEGLAIFAKNKWSTGLIEKDITAVGYYEGEVWLAGEGYLWKAEGKNTEKWEPVRVKRQLIRGKVKGMTFDNNGRLYLASDIFARYDSKEETTFVYDSDFGFEEKNLLCVGKDMEGDMWVGTQKNGLYRFKIFFEEPPKEILSVVARSEKVLECQGNKDGSILVEAKGGVGPYTYKWDKACIGNHPQNLGEGTYKVTITDSEGTEVFSEATVVSNSPIVIDIEKVKCISREGARDGELIIKATGGAGRLTYKWSDNRRTPMRRSLAAGEYEVTVTDSKGCQADQKLIVSQPRIIPELEPTMIKEGQIITLKELFFDADSLNFTEKSLPSLDEINQFLVDNKNIIIEIGGHTNGLPNHDYCDWLSNGRAEKVAQYFYNLGIKEKQLSYKGYGKRNAIASNQTASGRSKNQRVEIKIISVE